MLRNLKIIFIILWLFILIIWWVIPWIPQFKNIILPEGFLYFWVVSGWIFLVLILRLKSRITFIIVFILFLISAFLTAVSLQSVAETVMRISLIGWLMGFVQALIER